VLVLATDGPTVDPVARWLAVAGLAIAAAGLGLNWWRGRARVRLRPGSGRDRWWRIWWIHENIGLEVRAFNLTQAQVSIVAGAWQVKPRRLARPMTISTKHWSGGTDRDEPGNVPFPLAIPGLHAQSWHSLPPTFASMTERARGFENREIVRIRYLAVLGNERRVRSRWLLLFKLNEDDPFGRSARATDRAAFPRLWRPLKEIVGRQRRPQSPNPLPERSDVRAAVLNGRAEKGPLDGAAVSVDCPLEAMVRTIEVFVSPVALTPGGKWSGYGYGQRPTEALARQVNGYLPHRELDLPPEFPSIGNGGFEMVELENPSGAVSGGPLDGHRITIQAIIPEKRFLAVYILSGEARNEAVWHAHVYRPQSGFEYLGELVGDPTPTSQRV
jgi:hypothetical protein